MAKKKQLRQSETLDIMRSQIKMNPYNPKHHSERLVKEQKKNFTRIGYLGGIVWNKASGNIVDGHRRVMAMDELYGYDGTPATDYKIKVEVVELDEKKEKEQMTFMALANTKADLQLIAQYLPDIDVDFAGISASDLKDIESFLPSDNVVSIDTYDDLLSGSAESAETESAEDKVERVKETKLRQKELASDRYSNLTAYITISFSSPEQKQMFCELADINPEDNFITGDKVLGLIE